MKKIFVSLVLVLISSLAFAEVKTEKYAVLRPDGGVSIICYDPEQGKTLQSVIQELGFSGLPIQYLNNSDIPIDRSDRNFWTLQGKKIVVDQVKKQAALDAQALLDAKQTQAFAKLKISKEDWENLTNKKVNPSGIT